MNFLEPARIATIANASLIKCASSVLQDHFNLNKFYYYKIFNSGQIFLFESSLDFLECFEFHGGLLKYPSYCHPRYHHSGVRMSNGSEDPLLKELEEVQNRNSLLGFRLWVRLTNKTDSAVEEFGFHSAATDEKQCSFLFSHLTELRLFAKWFLEQNKLISFLEKSSLDLPSLIGSDFYKNRIEEADPSYLVRQKFLQDLGVQTKPDLSSVELDTIKLLARGYTAPQIATQLYRSKRTIEHRIENIKSKLQCFSRVELIQKVQEMENF